MPTRVKSKKKEARGIYQHAEVMPGHDWTPPSSDGGTLPGNTRFIILVSN